VLIRKRDCKIVNKLPGFPEDLYFIGYSSRTVRFHPTPAMKDCGMPERAEKIAVLSRSVDGKLGSQGTALFWADENKAQEFLDSLVDYAPPQKAPPAK
jgi:hypothetical protein